MPNQKPTHYDILRVPPDATRRLIGIAYRALQKQQHLVRNWDEIKVAYSTLNDEFEKAIYDIKLLEEREQHAIALGLAAKNKVELASQHCETLQISVNDANEDTIKQAFRARALEDHPDREGGDTAKFQNVNNAFESLVNSPESPEDCVRMNTAAQTALSSVQNELQAVKFNLQGAQKKQARKVAKREGGSQKKKKKKAGTSFPILPMCLSSLSFKLCILTAVIIVIQTSYTYSRHCRSSEEERWFSYEE